MAELGYDVHCFCFQDSPRRAHSIAAQGGINAAKNYQGDGDSIYRLAQISRNIIDQCVAQGVPFAREYGGLLDNRSFGGAQVSRTFYARGQTGQQLLLGAYQALERQIGLGTVKMHTRHEMLELVVVDGRARGIVTRDMVTGEIRSHVADAVVLATGGYGNVYYLSTNAMGCNVTAAWRAHRKGALFANPCYTQIHPTCIPVSGDHQSKLTLMSESLRNDGRIWVPKKAGDPRSPEQIPEDERDYYLERKYPSFGNLVPRDVASRNAKQVCDEGRGVGPGGLGVYLDFSESMQRLGPRVIADRYDNLFEMYERITGEDPYKVPMRIYPAIHYTMGGLWVDYNLMSNIPGLYVTGEANFSDHGANRLGASALMQGLADGYFILPYTIGDYLAQGKPPALKTTAPEFVEAEEAVRDRTSKLLGINGSRTVDSFHKELGHVMWEYCGMSRTDEGLKEALDRIPKLREEFWSDVRVVGAADSLNQSLEKAGRVADFLEMGELLCIDALHRTESCGGHFREESQTPEGEALRDDDNFSYVAAWEWNDSDRPILHKEPLEFEYVHLTQRSYK
jgi:succinate dehydrogenase / fumarate reductase flavoprotein subunit